MVNEEEKSDVIRYEDFFNDLRKHILKQDALCCPNCNCSNKFKVAFLTDSILFGCDNCNSWSYQLQLENLNRRNER